MDKFEEEDDSICTYITVGILIFGLGFLISMLVNGTGENY